MKTAVEQLADKLPFELKLLLMTEIEQAKEIEKRHNSNLLEWIRENAIEVIDGWQCGDEKYTDSELIELYQHLQQ